MHLEENKSKNNYLNKKDKVIKAKLMLCISKLINNQTLETLIVILIFLWLCVISLGVVVHCYIIGFNHQQSSVFVLKYDERIQTMTVKSPRA